MPNWTNNTVTASKDAIDLLINADGEVDFNRITPRAKDLPSGDIPSHVEGAARHALGLRGKCGEPIAHRFDDLSDEEKRLCLEYQASYRKHGALNWYDWNCDNWGTKWNAHATERVSDESVWFETAWCVPAPVLIKLASLANEDITVVYTDEDDDRMSVHTIVIHPDGTYQEQVVFREELAGEDLSELPF